MATLTGLPRTVQLVATTNLRPSYIRTQIIGNEFTSSYSRNSAIAVLTQVYVFGNTLCPNGKGQQRIITIPGTFQYHAYSSSNIGPLKNGKLIQPGKTWQQCGIGRGLWYIVATFTPTQCWRAKGWKVTRSYPYQKWICNPCNSWPLPCGC